MADTTCNIKMTFPTKELIRRYFDEDPAWLQAFENDLENQPMGCKDGSNGYYYPHKVDESKFKDARYAYSIMDSFREEYLGIDIPTLIEADNAVKTIMIIGQDPLRSAKPVKAAPDRNTVFIGTPYGVEIDTVKTRNTGGTHNLEVYRKIFNGLLKDGYRIYLTDALKFYTSSKSDKVTSIEKYSKLLKDSAVLAGKRPETLLEAEYNCMHPDIVCCFGNKAYEIAVHTSFGSKMTKVFHPSYLARIFGSSSNRLTEYSIAEIKGKLTAAQKEEFEKMQKEQKK